MHNKKENDTINLKLKYTDSAGKLHTFSGTGVLHSDSFIDPVLKKHKIRVDKVAFPSTNVAQATFSIEPQYGQIELYTRDVHIGGLAEPITNITISMNVGPNDRIITPINSDFIGTDIARTADIKNISGVNDGTNWTSLTIGSDTYGLGGGGSSEPVNWSDILNKPTFATVATSGSYNDLSDKPTIPTKTSQLTNDSNFVTSAALTGYTTEQRVQEMIDASIGTAIGGTY